MRREVDIAAHRGQLRHPGRLAEVEELLQLPRLPVQPIQVPDHHRIQVAAAKIIKHPPIRGPCLAAVGAHIVIDVALRNLPALPRDQPLTVLDLATDTKLTPHGQTRSERR